MAMGVTVDFTANVAQFSQQVDRARGDLDRFRVQAESVSQRANDALGKIGIGLSIAGIGAFIKSGIDAADALNDLSDKTGVAIEVLSGYQHVVELGGTSMAALTGGFNKLSIGIKANADEFAALGVSASDPAEAFLQLADIFKSIDDPQKRASFGAKALGKSYAELAPLMLMGSDAIREQIKVGQDMFGITTESAQAAGHLNDEIDKLTRTVQGFGSILGANVLPYLNQFLDIMTGANADTNNIDVLTRKIEVQKEKIEALKAESGGWALVDGLLGYDVGEEVRNLELLQRKMDSLKDKAAIKPAVVQELAIDKFLGGDDKAAKDEVKEQVDPAKKELERLLEQAQEFSRGFEAETRRAGMSDINKAKEDALDIAYKLADAGLDDAKIGDWLELTNQSIAANFAKKASLEAIDAEQKRVAKSAEELDAANHALIESGTQYADDALARNARINEEVSLLGLSADERKKRLALYDIEVQLQGRLADIAASVADDQVKQDFAANARTVASIDRQSVLAQAVADEQRTLADESTKVWDNAARSVQQSLADYIFDPFSDGLDGMLDGFLNTIKRMAAEAAAANIMTLLVGKQGGASGGAGGALGGLLGGVLGSAGVGVGNPFNGTGAQLAFQNDSSGAASIATGALKLIGSFFGGMSSFAVGTDYVPHDQIARIHKGERIIPAAQNTPGRSSGGGVSVKIENYGTSKDFEVEQLSPDEVRIIARNEAKQVVSRDAGRVVAAHLGNANSQVSKALGRNTLAARKL